MDADSSTITTTTGALRPAATAAAAGRSRGWLPRVPLPRVPLPGLPGLPRLSLPRLPGGGNRSAAAAAAGATATLATSSASGSSGLAAAAAKKQVKLKPASDVVAGALARALSQGTIHPLDTLKVRMQTARSGGLGGGAAAAKAAAKPPTAALPPPAAAAAAAATPPAGLSKFGRLVPPPGAHHSARRAAGDLAVGLGSLYRGVVGAASGAGIAIGAYFAFYGAACNALAAHTDLAPGAVAFVAGGIAAAGSSVVKVPLAVCIRSVQAGVYPNAIAAATAITAKAGPAGLFTGFAPTLLEDVPDMAVKFAAYESLRGLHRRARGGEPASPGEDFAMGALAGAVAAAATTPLDVIKTRMMCAAASRPTMLSAAREVMAYAGPRGFVAGLGARAVSNGVNSAVFFCFFEAIRSALAPTGPGGEPACAAEVRERLALLAALARERVERVPRLLALPPASAYGGGHGWATAAGAGGGLALVAAGLSGGGAGSAAAAGGAAGEAALLLCGGADDLVAGGGRAGAAPLSLSLLARASPLRVEDSHLALALRALRSVEESASPTLDDEV